MQTTIRPLRCYAETSEVNSVLPVNRANGKHAALHDYLFSQDAETVILTFKELEEIQGWFTLLASTRQNRSWWQIHNTIPMLTLA